WTLTAAADAAVSVRCARNSAATGPGTGSCWIVRRGRGVSGLGRAASGWRWSRSCAGADDCGRDRGDARDAALDRLRDPGPDRDGKARPARARATGARRALAAGRADPGRRREAP